MMGAIRVRGEVDVTPAIKTTMRLLRLDRINHLVLVDESQRPMLEKVQSRVTFGEIDAETLALVLKKRGALSNTKRLDERFLKENKIKDFKDLAKALAEKKARLQDFGIKPVFRLGPPKKGYENAGIKKGYSSGGALGYRGSDINILIRRMI